jgi:hypothetical protein
MITHSFFCLREGIYSMMKKQIKNILVTESQLTRLVNQLKEDDKNPCWDGYEMIGMKEKDGKEVPNCVPIEEEILQEAEYQGRKVTLNKPTRGDVKKFKVYVKNDKGNVVKVNFGHGGTSAKKKGEKTMRIKKSNPERRKSFRARHNCDNPGPKWKARYWSCKAW